MLRIGYVVGKDEGTATVAPTLFKSLSAHAAGVFLQAFFLLYYLWGLALAMISVALAATAN